MFDEELNSFLLKFHQLRRAGLTAHLDLDTHAGKSWIGLRVILGSDQNQDIPKVKRRSPSYFRRQERRKAERATNDPKLADGDTAEEATNNTKDDDKAEKVLTEVQENDKYEEDLTRSSASNQNVRVAEEASFDCELCDFVSNRRNGVAIHMSRKHPNIEQLDGNVTLSEPKLNSYGKYRPEILNEVHEEIENFLKNERNVGEANLDTWEDIIQEIEMCKLLTVSEKKKEITRVIEA